MGVLSGTLKRWVLSSDTEFVLPPVLVCQFPNERKGLFVVAVKLPNPPFNVYHFPDVSNGFLVVVVVL